MPMRHPFLILIFISRSEKVHPLNAALGNCMSFLDLNFDDSYLETIIHPAGTVASALFAMALDRPVTGGSF
jgi:2-methylcitrate dehydratase PrpD